jgi:DNA modification methylase
MRLEVAQEMKLKEVPCVKVIVDDPEKEREILLRMNVLNGSWNIELLKDFDITTVLEAGFKDIDLTGMWDDSLETDDDDFDVEAELEKIIVPKTKLGEIYALGNHVLGCGDSTDQEFVKKILGGTNVDMIYSDPKYNINLSYNKGIGGKSSYGGKTDDNMSEDDYREFLKKAISNGLSVAKPDCHVFFYNDQRSIGLVQDLYSELGIDNKRVCIWAKNGFNPTPKVAFNKSYEPCIYGTIGKPYISPKILNLSEILNKEVASGNRQLDDLLDMIDIWMVKRMAGQEYNHPTEKPPTLHEKAIRRCTKPGDVVLDLFSGSGSTLIACEMLKRRCYTIDVDSVFCDLTIARYEALTGLKARLISGGKDGK